MTLIHVCAHVGFPSCLSLSQLRSAGAAVIQELFPRVSSIATLDISDNGSVAHCNTTHCDLDFLSQWRRGLNGLLMDHAMLSFVYVDRPRRRSAHSTAGPLQAPLPQTPSSGQELQHQKQVHPWLCVTLYCSYLWTHFVCVCIWIRAAYASLNIHICDCTYIFLSGCC